MVGGVIAIVWGLLLLLLGIASGSLWPRGTSPGISPQQFLTHWVVWSLLVGGVPLVGGARAPGAALVGSSFCSFLAWLLKSLYGGQHLETLVHGAIILGSVGLIVFGLAGLRGAAGEGRRRRALAEEFGVPPVLVRAPLGRYPMALPLAFVTVVVGALLIPWIQTAGWGGYAVHGFEDPWVQPLLAFNVAFLALLFLVEAWQASRSSGKEEAGDGPMSAVWDRVMEGLARGGGPFLLYVPAPDADSGDVRPDRQDVRLAAVVPVKRWMAMARRRWWRPRLIVRPLGRGSGVELRPSMHNAVVFAAAVVPVFLLAVLVSWFLREDLRLSFGATIASVVVGLILVVGVPTIALARSFVRAGPDGLQISSGVRTATLRWADIDRLEVDTALGVIRVENSDGSKVSYEATFIRHQDDSTAVDVLEDEIQAHLGGHGGHQQDGGSPRGLRQARWIPARLPPGSSPSSESRRPASSSARSRGRTRTERR